MNGRPLFGKCSPKEWQSCRLRHSRAKLSWSKNGEKPKTDLDYLRDEIYLKSEHSFNFQYIYAIDNEDTNKHSVMMRATKL